MSEAPSVAEQYLSATNSTNLKVKEHGCDADKLLAAGYAVGGDPARMLALQLWRMRATGSTQGFEPVADVLDAWANSRLIRKGKRVGKHTRQAVRKTMWWWLNPICPSCDGRGHPVIPDTPVLDDTRDCPDCLGTGHSSLERLVSEQQREMALEIRDELDRLSGLVFADMSRLLKKQMDGL